MNLSDAFENRPGCIGITFPLLSIFIFAPDECKGAKAAKKKETKQQTVYTVATKQLLISLAPPVLTLHLKRFQQARFTLRKLTKPVEFPLQLNLAPFCSRNGKVSENGTFYSYKYIWDQSWPLFDITLPSLRC